MSTPFLHFFTKINQILPLESNFTEVLEAIVLKPKTLYFYGKMPQNVSKTDKIGKNGETGETGKAGQTGRTGQPTRPKTVAIVGSRHNTTYGQEVAYQLAYTLAKRGVVVVSGLAYGIDSIAHRGCLAAGGTTVAVLGTPINQIYPRQHLALAAEILQTGGAIISEYAPQGQGSVASEPAVSRADLAPGEYLGKDGQRHLQAKAAFLYRNRLIAGLADAVVVVEAAVRSGSLNTAAHALEQGKDVFAVPGNITNPYSQGCNRLIAQGAYPYSEPDDVLRGLFPEDYRKKCQKLHQNRLIGDTDAETAVLQALSSGARGGGEIMQKALLPPEVFNQTITLLEIKSRVRSLGANNWCLA